MELSREDIRRIIKEEMDQALDNQSGDVEEIQRKIHRFWKKFSTFYTREAEPAFQKLTTATEKLQLPLDKQANLRKRIMELKYELGNLIENINRLKSFVDETTDSEEDAEFSPDDDFIDGYGHQVDKGGDYYGT